MFAELWEGEGAVEEGVEEAGLIDVFWKFVLGGGFGWGCLLCYGFCGSVVERRPPPPRGLGTSPARGGGRMRGCAGGGLECDHLGSPFPVAVTIVFGRRGLTSLAVGMCMN